MTRVQRSPHLLRDLCSYEERYSMLSEIDPSRSGFMEMMKIWRGRRSLSDSRSRWDQLRVSS